jgi:hypothetical protein
VQQFVLQEHPGLARLVRAQLVGRRALAQRGERHEKKTRSVLKTNCRDSLDHMQPMWFRSFRSELSRVMNYCRGLREIQSEFLGIFTAKLEQEQEMAHGLRPLPLRGSRIHWALRGEGRLTAKSGNRSQGTRRHKAAVRSLR